MKGNKGLAPHRRKASDDFALTSNQWQSNPKQQLFLEYYFDPNAKGTFGNVFQSAIKAGYSENYARTLTRKDNKNMWIREFARKTQFTQEHILAGITNIATNPESRQADRLQAYALLAKLSGMIIDRSATVSVNIEAALNELT